ncbi:MAG: CDP-alcohol phosphatidyltransferase family protein [Deltaproteobacteria bacterium]|nr:CDP-alcohol phosphatidyltransferase family protein [Deltaproteobacteria bacterium]
MIKDKFGDRLDQWIHTIFPFLFKRKVDPNLLTVLGALICVGAAIAFGMGEFVVGALLLLLGGLFDLVDGVVARHFDGSTAFGAFLDSTLDRMVDMAVLLGLVVHYALTGDQTTALVAGVGMISSVLTSYTKARAEAIDVELRGGSIVERGERIVLLIAGGLFGIMQIALWVLAVGATATVVQRFTSARRGLEAQDVERAARPRGGEQLLHGD